MGQLRARTKATEAMPSKEDQKGLSDKARAHGCSGNIISLLDGADPNFKTFATQMVNFVSHSLMAAEGDLPWKSGSAILAATYSAWRSSCDKNNGYYTSLAYGEDSP
jgi:hydrogenase small subunit